MKLCKHIWKIETIINLLHVIIDSSIKVDLVPTYVTLR